MTGAARQKSRRLDIRATEQERALIDRAVEASGVGLTEFVIGNLVVAAREVLADRTRFVLDGAALEKWEQINARPARELAGLRALIARPSPFVD